MLPTLQEFLLYADHNYRHCDLKFTLGHGISVHYTVVISLSSFFVEACLIKVFPTPSSNLNSIFSPSGKCLNQPWGKLTSPVKPGVQQ